MIIDLIQKENTREEYYRIGYLNCHQLEQALNKEIMGHIAHMYYSEISIRRNIQNSFKIAKFWEAGIVMKVDEENFRIYFLLFLKYLFGFCVHTSANAWYVRHIKVSPSALSRQGLSCFCCCAGYFRLLTWELQSRAPVSISHLSGVERGAGIIGTHLHIELQGQNLGYKVPVASVFTCWNFSPVLLSFLKAFLTMLGS